MPRACMSPRLGTGLRPCVQPATDDQSVELVINGIIRVHLLEEPHPLLANDAGMSPAFTRGLMR